MFDLNAPIIPGEFAAGIKLGQSINNIIVSCHPISIVSLAHGMKYCFDFIRLWTKNDRVVQISVIAGYQGTVHGSIGIGSTVQDVQKVFGVVVEDDEDNLTVPTIVGWCFETEKWLHKNEIENNLDSKINEIFVYEI